MNIRKNNNYKNKNDVYDDDARSKRKFTCWVDCVRDNCDDYYNPQNRSLSAATHRAAAGDH
jgi:outer membrane protein assembly factor BamA